MSLNIRTPDPKQARQPKSWRDVLPIHPAAELFPRMSESELRELGEDIKARGGIHFPIVVYEGKLLDGRNRLDAMELVGLTFDCTDKLNLRVHRLNRQETDPYEFVLSANLHRRHLTSEQKRDLIAKVLKAKPEASNATVAKQTKTTDKTVAKVRSKLESTSEIPKLNKIVGADGKSRPKTKKTKKSATPAAPPKTVIDLNRSDYSEVPAASAKPTSPAKPDPIGSSPVRHSEVPATSVPRLSAAAHFLVNDISRQLREVDGKLSAQDRSQLFAKIRALVDPDDIVSEVVRLVEKMTPAQRRDFIARLQKEGFSLPAPRALQRSPSNNARVSTPHSTERRHEQDHRSHWEKIWTPDRASERGGDVALSLSLRHRACRARNQFAQRLLVWLSAVLKPTAVLIPTIA
jgi:hypothetical protein